MINLTAPPTLAGIFAILRFAILALPITALLSLVPWRAAAESMTPKTLTINTEQVPPKSTNDGTGYDDLIAKEMYKRLGIDIIFNHLPSERVLVNVNKGLDDGLLSRVGGLAHKYRNLVQIEESVERLDFVAFSRKTDVRLAGWESLKPYTVGIITGWKILERNIKGVQSLTKVRNADQLFTFLDLDRVDLVVLARLPGLQMIKDRGLKGFRVLEPPLATRETYFYLHKKHRNLASRASAALRDMKADGTYRRIIDHAIKPLLIN